MCLTMPTVIFNFYRTIPICIGILQFVGHGFGIVRLQSGFGAEDDKIYEREIGRAALSLADAVKRKPKEILFFTHYPPVTAAEWLTPDFGADAKIWQ